MPTPYSPIDESSYTETTSFDPEAMLNPRIANDSKQHQRPADNQADAAEPNTAETTLDNEDGTSAQTTAPRHTPETGYRNTVRFAFLKGLTKCISDMRTFKFLGIVLFFFAAYAFVVCCSYFMTISSDQSALLNGEIDLSMYENAGRKFGAILAHTLIYEWVGIGAFILIFYIGACGLSMIGVYKPGFWGMTMRSLLSTVALSVILGLATYDMPSPIYWGGLHGHVLNERLIAYSGYWGALAISLILGSMMVLLYLSELKSVLSTVGNGINGYREKQAERRARREARRAEIERAKAAEAERLEAERMQREQDEAQKAEAEKSEKQQAEMPTDTPAHTPKAAPAIEIAPEPTEKAEKPEKSDQPEIPDPHTDPYTDEAINEDAGQDATDNIDDGPLMPLFPDSQPHADTGHTTTLSDPNASDPRERPLYDPRADLSRYRFPTLSLLNDVPLRQSVDASEMEENNARITKTLSDYGIAISHIKATVGPTVTLYEIIPAEGVRISKIKNLEDDIALSLAALGIRIIAPIPGRGTIGIEVPNKDPQTVSMRSVLESEKFQNSHMDLPMAIGRTVSNEVYMADLTKMPHLLVAGATGMGKSVGLNAIIASLLYKKHPSELKFVMIDPKKVEFSLYANLERHYLAKLPDEEDAIITDPSKVVATLNSLCVEMENRYALLKDAQTRNVKEYNERFMRHALNPERGHRYLPYIVVVVDEFADLIITAGKEVETPIARIAQMARAVGIHMILATQRPSTNVITGVIKANFPGRIAFRVFQMVDSRTIIDRPGANQLIGRGDMLFSNNGKIERVQCAFIDTPEVTAICNFIGQQVGYDHAYELPEYTPDSSDSGSMASLGDRDPLFDECARLVVSTDTASTSSLQRRYSIGYNRAGKIMDQMEAAGIVGPAQGGKPRQVLIDPMALERILENRQ